jgi:hypothetical protein
MIAICDIETDGKLFESTITDVYSQIIVDVNGAKAPNQFGTDVFLFELLNNRIVPRGLPEFSIGILSFEDFCYQHGHACAGWVIINGNTDYLKCSGLSWDVKTSCN